MKNIAIITARSGSKGLPHKNIRPLAGKPLMAWSIEAALQSGMFDTVMVSTDSEEYAEIARQYGAEVPFLRSEAMSQDNSNSRDVIVEVLNEYKKLGREFDNFMIVQPTSPLRTAEDIKNAFKLMEETGGTAVVGACECEHSPILAYSFDETFSYGGNRISMQHAFKNTYPQLFDSNGGYLRRQALPTFYRTNGAIFIVNVARFERNHNYYDSNCYAYIMPQENSLDIDTELDFVLAEAVLRHYNRI